MLAVEYHANDDVRIVELPMPEIGPGELLVQLRACGLCARDVMEWYMKPRASIQPGDSVLVLGAGSNGLMLAQLAQQCGAGRVIIADPIAYRRQHALEIGIDHALDPLAGTLLEQVLAANDGHKPDIVLVTPSTIDAMQQGIELAGPGGTVLLFAPPLPTGILPITPHQLFFQEITLLTSYSAGP